MKVTFLIGNGFDLSLGMKTRFADMYDSYIKSASNDQVVEEFKKYLKSNSSNNYATWGDFEISMARHIDAYSNEDDFIKCVRDFKGFMARHLQNEQDKFFSDLNLLDVEIVYAELKRSFSDFYRFNTPNVTNSVLEIKKQSTALFYSIIDFNYTEILDEIYEKTNAFNLCDKPIHIHGSLSADVVLGADNPEQFENITFPISRRLERAFIKPKSNQNFDISRVNKSKALIENSDIICVYGMSFGLSDLTWTTMLYQWLRSNPNHHLFYFGRKKVENSLTWLSDELLDIEEIEKQLVLSRICKEPEEVDEMIDQVHVPLTNDIFMYRELIDKRKQQIAERTAESEKQNELNARRTIGSMA